MSRIKNNGKVRGWRKRESMEDMREDVCLQRKLLLRGCLLTPSTDFIRGDGKERKGKGKERMSKLGRRKGG